MTFHVDRSCDLDENEASVGGGELVERELERGGGRNETASVRRRKS